MTEEIMALAARLATVRRSIEQAARRVGRDPASVRLIAVSKLQPAARAQAAVAAGQLDLGENYAQELRDKAAEVPGARWHMIGNLQRNKAKYVVGLADLLHTLDSLGLAEEVSRRALARGQAQRCLIQVNLGDETQKSGCAPAEVSALVDEARGLGGLRLEGFMCLPPLASPEETRPHFRELARLAQEERRRTGLALAELSMGMSADFEVAIEEGATMVRVGTAIFGERRP